MKKGFFIVLISVGASILIAGCASGGKQTIETTSADSTTVTTTTVKEATLEIVESGFYTTNNDEVNQDRLTNVFAVVKNTSEKEAISFPAITATAKDSEGKILASEEQVSGYLHPGESTVIHTLVSTGSISPVSVDFLVNTPKFVSDDKSKPYNSNFVVSNTNVNRSASDYNDSTSITGEITNNNDEDISSLSIHVVLKKGGKAVDCITSYVNDYPAGKTKPFEASSLNSKVPDFDSYDIYVESW